MTIEMTVALQHSVYLPYEYTLSPIYVHATSLGFHYCVITPT